MYTGITQGYFEVTHIICEPHFMRYTLAFSESLLAGLSVGASVAIDGVCQTVVSILGQDVSFEAIAETLKKTTLADLYIGRYVNVERSARWGDEIGGHEIAGHILETGCIVSRQQEGQMLQLEVQCSKACMGYLCEKGFIALDGASLTLGPINKVKNSFLVYLIPETLRRTGLGKKPVGGKVNLEVDSKTKIIVDLFQNQLTDLEARFATLERFFSEVQS